MDGQAVRTTVAALYVETGGSYFGLPGVDPWDEARDARRYAGPWPVVAHPPCQRWGKFWAGQPLWIKRTGERKIKGDDGGCFASALASVREWGGVLEHPWGSHAWPHFGLNVPPRKGGWIAADMDGYVPPGHRGGWTCCVEQGRYGHYARKPTLLLGTLGTARTALGHQRTVLPARGCREIRAGLLQARRGTGVQGRRQGQLTPHRHPDGIPRPSHWHGRNGGGMTSGTIRITARTLDLAREALADWLAENPRRALDRVSVTHGGEGVVIEARWSEE